MDVVSVIPICLALLLLSYLFLQQMRTNKDICKLIKADSLEKYQLTTEDGTTMIEEADEEQRVMDLSDVPAEALIRATFAKHEEK